MAIVVNNRYLCFVSLIRFSYYSFSEGSLWGGQLTPLFQLNVIPSMSFSPKIYIKFLIFNENVNRQMEYSKTIFKICKCSFNSILAIWRYQKHETDSKNLQIFGDIFNWIDWICYLKLLIGAFRSLSWDFNSILSFQMQLFVYPSIWIASTSKRNNFNPNMSIYIFRMYYHKNVYDLWITSIAHFSTKWIENIGSNMNSKFEYSQKWN